MSDYKSRSSWENELIEWIGYDALIKLEQAYGGTFRYIHAGKPDVQLTEKIGQEAAQALSDVFGPGDIYVPMVALKTKRNSEIMKQHNAGKTVEELAAQFRLKRDRITRILKEGRRSSEQNQ